MLRGLARLRVPLGFVFGALALWLAQPTSSSLPLGAAIAVAGESIRVWAAGHLNKSREVTTSGPYRYFAHPLYIGSSVMGVGLAVASASLAVTLLVTLYLSVTITAAIRTEEAFLRRAFGGDYDRYRSGRSPSHDNAHLTARRFSLAQAMRNREYRAVAGLAAALLLLALKATYNASFGRS